MWKKDKLLNNMSHKYLKTEFVLTCDYAFLAEGSKLSMIGKFETIFSSIFPAGHPEMFVVAHFKGEPDSQHNISLSVLDPNGKDVLPKDVPVLKVKLSSQGTGNLIQRFLNFPVNMPGLYKIVILEDNNEVGNLDLNVIKVKNDKSVPN